MKRGYLYVGSAFLSCRPGVSLVFKPQPCTIHHTPVCSEARYIERPAKRPCSFSLKLTELARSGNISRMEELVHSTRKSEFVLNEIHYTTIASGYANAGSFQKFFDVLAYMRDLKIPPKNGTLRLIAKTCTSWKKRKMAVFALERAVQWYADDAKESAEVRTWNRVLIAFTKLGAYGKTIETLNRMISTGARLPSVPTPDAQSFNICLSALTSTEDYLGAFALFARMKFHGKSFSVFPDAVTYSLLLQHALTSDLFALTSETRPFSKICLLNDSLSFAQRIRESMERNNIPMNNRIRTQILRLITRKKPQDEKQKISVADLIKSEWKHVKSEKGETVSDLKLFNALLFAFGQVGDATGMSEVLDEMLNRKVKFDKYSFQAILVSLSRCGRADLTEETFENWRRCYGTVDKYSYTELLCSLGRCSPRRSEKALFFMEQAVEDGVAWTDAMVHACLSSFGDDAMGAIRCWQSLRSRATEDCMQAVQSCLSCSALMRACGKAGRPDLALRLFYAFQSSGLLNSEQSLGIQLYQAFVRGLQNGGKEREVNKNILKRQYLEHLQLQCRTFTLELPLERIRIKY